MRLDNSIRNYQDGFQAADITTPQMRQAIEEWFDLYFDAQATETSDPCQKIPYTVVNKLTRTAFSEYTAQAEGFAGKVLKALDARRKKAMQMALIGGECLLKPIPEGNGFRFGVVNRANMLVFGRDGLGRITDMGTAEHVTGDRFFYTLLERRRADEKLTISYRLFRSDSPGSLGKQVSLKELNRYAQLPEELVLPGGIGVGLATLRTPSENCVDGSEDPVSVYAAAVGLIRNINRNEAQLNGEFQRGESRIITSSDFMKREKDGSRSFSDHIFVGLDEDPENIGVTIFSPQLREASFLARKQDYLRSVENMIGLKRGILSQVEAVQRTATEITSSSGDYHLTVMDFRQAWEEAVREALVICGTLGGIYRLEGAQPLSGEEATFQWGNGVLFDETAQN